MPGGGAASVPTAPSGPVAERAAHASAPHRPPGSTAYAWWVVAVLCLCSIVAFIDRQIINLLVEPMKRDLGVTDVQISLLQGVAFGLTHALLAVPLGRLADARDRRAIILAGIACWTLACAGSGLASSFVVLFAMRMLIGVGEATLTPSGYSMLADYFPRERLGRAISLFLGAGFVGSGLAFVGGGWLLSRLDAGAGVVLPLFGPVHAWQAAFLVAALPGVLCFLLMLSVREPARTGVGRAGPAGDAPGFGAVLRFVVAQRRTIGAIYVGFALLAAMQFGLGAWVPSFFIRTYGWSASSIGYAFGLCYMTAGTFGVLAGGWLSDRLLARGRPDANLLTGVIAGACALPFVLAFPAMPTGTLALALLVPATFFGTMPFGAGTAALPLLAPNRMRAQIVALYLLVANLLGQALGPTYVAALTDWVFRDPAQLRWSLVIACGSLLVAGIAVIASGLRHVGHALAGAAAREGAA
jgi:MFS family permease